MSPTVHIARRVQSLPKSPGSADGIQTLELEAPDAVLADGDYILCDGLTYAVTDPRRVGELWQAATHLLIPDRDPQAPLNG